MKAQPVRLPVAISSPTLRFLIVGRWAMVLLAPVMWGLSEFRSTPALWIALGAVAAITLFIQVRARRAQGRVDRRFWYVAVWADLFLFTAIVVMRGGFRTDAYLLYILAMSEAGLVLGTGPAILAGVSACVMYAFGTLGLLGDTDVNRLLIRSVYLLVIGTATAVLAAAEKRALVASLTDFKTHVPNFRYFQASLREAIASNRGTPLSVAILDVDGFKQLNAAVGHPMADKVLEQLADLLARSVRSTDLLARYGGEEFIVLLPGTDCETAERIMERLRLRVAEHSFRTINGAPPVHITISIGIAGLKPGLTDSQLMVRADRALQLAKRYGKNQVLHVD